VNLLRTATIHAQIVREWIRRGIGLAVLGSGVLLLIIAL